MKSFERDPMNKVLLTVVTCAACLFAAGGAFADDADTNKPRTASNTFASLDRNGDHRISRSEAGFDRVLSQTFAEIDTDGDGFVSTDEFTTADKSRTAANR
jgi:hypothetical protein